jgi:hypothetical protein
MNVFAIIGVTMVVGLIMAGAYWLTTNLTLKTATPNRYTYKTDAQGNDLVADNEEDTKE